MPNGHYIVGSHSYLFLWFVYVGGGMGFGINRYNKKRSNTLVTWNVGFCAAYKWELYTWLSHEFFSQRL